MYKRQGFHGWRVASDAYGISTLDPTPDNALFQISTLELHHSQSTAWEATLKTQAGSGLNVLSLLKAPTSRLHAGPFGALGYDNNVRALFQEEASNWDLRVGGAAGISLGEVLELSALYSRSVYASQQESTRLSAHATLDLGMLSGSVYLDSEERLDSSEATVRMEAGLCF